MDKQLTDSGAKAQQRTDNEDRAKIYRDWHRTLKADLAMFDVDTIEWRRGENGLVPVAVIELTRTDSEDVRESYLKAILDRFDVRDKQGEAIRKVAKALGVNAYITLFNLKLTKFWVYNLTQEKGWNSFTKEEYIKFLETRKSLESK